MQVVKAVAAAQVMYNAANAINKGELTMVPKSIILLEL